MIGENTVREEFKMEPTEFLRHIDNYKKNIASQDHFRKILMKFDKLKEYEVDVWCGNITLRVKIGYYYINIDFYFFEFDLDELEVTKYQMERYLNKDYYNLYFSTEEQFITYEELKSVNKEMEKIKAIIDGVLGGKE